MLRRQDFPRIDIPGLEFKAKLNSKEVGTDESKDLLEIIIAYLIREGKHPRPAGYRSRSLIRAGTGKRTVPR